MTKSALTDFPSEQQVCVQCGFCCDGTLFTYAHLFPGEYPNLPSSIKARYQSEGEDESFELACPCFVGKCNIYDQHKPTICSTFRCRVLKRMAKQEISPAEAGEAIARFKEWRQEIFDLYEAVSGEKCPNSFTDLLRELPGLHKKNDGTPQDARIDLLLMKCGLLDVTLTKYFRLKGAFQDLLKMEAPNE